MDKHIKNFECFLEVFDNVRFVKIMGKAIVFAIPIAVFIK